MYATMLQSKEGEPVYLVSPTLEELVKSQRLRKHFLLKPYWASPLDIVRERNMLLSFWTVDGDPAKTRYWARKSLLQINKKSEVKFHTVISEKQVEYILDGAVLTFKEGELHMMITLSESVEELQLKLESKGLMSLPMTQIKVLNNPDFEQSESPNDGTSES